jgi:hypothetical protein
MSQRPPVWKMVLEAVEHLDSPTTNGAIRDYVTNKYDNVNTSTLNCAITICSVNSSSRIHFPENRRPRLCESQYDFCTRLIAASSASTTPRRMAVRNCVRKQVNWSRRYATWAIYLKIPRSWNRTTMAG